MTEWPLGYELVHIISGAIYFVGVLSIHVPCMQLSLETLTQWVLMLPRIIHTCCASMRHTHHVH